MKQYLKLSSYSKKSRNLKSYWGPNLPNPTMDFIVNPFNELVDSVDFLHKRNTIFIIEGRMGQGKTFSCQNHLIPKLLNEDKVKLATYLVPETSLKVESEFAAAIAKNCKNVIVTDSMDDAEMYLDDPALKVLLVTTNQAWTQKKGKLFQERLIRESVKIALFLDEAHTWMCTLIGEGYRKITGNSNTSYNASLVEMVKTLSNHTPYIFGLTATPTLEMKGEINSAPGIEYCVINEACPKEFLVGLQSWINKVKFIKPNEVGLVFDDAIASFLLRDKKYRQDSLNKTKPVFMISVTRKDGDWPLDKVLQILSDRVKTISRYTDEEIVVLSSNFKGIYNLDGDRKAHTEGECIRKLNDVNSSAKFLVMVEKGKCGINVSNISDFFSFRPAEKPNGLGRYITNSHLQIVGRSSRANKKFLGKTEGTRDIRNYILTEIVQNNNLTTAEKIEKVYDLIEQNSVNIYVPDTLTWREAISELESSYMSNRDEVISWLNSIYPFFGDNIS